MRKFVRKTFKWRGIAIVWAFAGSGAVFVQACSSSDEAASASDGGHDVAPPEGGPISTTSPADGALSDAGRASAPLVTGVGNKLLGVTNDGNVIYIDGSGRANAVPIGGGEPTLIAPNATTGFVSRNTAFVWSAVNADAGGPSGVGTLTTWSSGVAVDRGGLSVVGIGAAAVNGTVAYLTNAFGAQAYLVVASGSDAGAPVTVDAVFTATAKCISPQGLLLFFDVGASRRFVAQFCPSTSSNHNVVTTSEDGSNKLTFASRSVIGALTTEGGRIAFVQAGTEAGGVLHIANPDSTGNDQTTSVADVVSAQFVADGSAVVYARSAGGGVEIVPVTASASSPAASVVSANAIGAGAASRDGHYVLTYSARSSAMFRDPTNVVLSTTALGVGGGGRVLEPNPSSCVTCLARGSSVNFLSDHAHVAIVDPLDRTGMFGPMRILPLTTGGAESVAGTAVWEFRPLPVDAGAGSSVGLMVEPTPGTYGPPNYRPTFDLTVRDVTGARPPRAIATGVTAYSQRASQAELVYEISSGGAPGIYATLMP